METAEKISITMTPEMMRTIRASVASGECASTSEALRDAVRVWQREREEHARRLESIQARIHRSIDDPRPSVTGEEVKRRLVALHEETVSRQDSEDL